MASLGAGGEGGAREELKSQFTTREGTYRLASAVEFSRTTRPLTYVPPSNNTSPAPGTSPPVRISFVSHLTAAGLLAGEEVDGEEGSPGSSRSTPGSLASNSMVHNNTGDYTTGGGTNSTNGSGNGNNHDENNPDVYTTPHRFCLNIGKELFVYPFMGIKKPVDMSKPIDKRIYKGTNPTCHDFNLVSPSQDSLLLLIGFSGGQIQLVDPISKEVNKLYNEERVIDKTRVTCIRWVPSSTSLFLVSHASGHIYLYNVDNTSGTAAPTYQVHKTGPGFTVSNCKSKSPRNPINKWTLGEGAINEFAFSSCGQYLAAVSQDGFLRIFRYENCEMVGLTRSYFGGLLCVCWSPDGKYICVGGEDDLVTMWSFNERRVVARGQGHKSWVSVVAFDPVTTTYGDIELSEDCIANELNSCGNCANNPSDCQSSGVFSCDSVGTSSTINATTNCIACQQNSNGKPLVNHVNNNSSTLASNPASVIVTNSSISNNHTCAPNFPRNSRHSRTSDSMRLSTSEPPNTRIPACYRIGSIGQDTQLCLWDLTEDIIKQPFGKNRPASRTPGRMSGGDISPCAIHSKTFCNSHQNHLPNSNCGTATAKTLSDKDEAPVLVVNNIGDSAGSVGVQSGSSSTATTNVTVGNSSNGNPATSVPQSNSNSSSGHNHGGILSLRFGALSFGGGDKDKSKDKEGKEHKRNFSLGSSSNKSDKNPGGSNSKSTGGGPASKLVALGLNIDKFDDPLKLIGTQACPRLDECPLLEPLICKKISHERLTTLIFREESLVTACQDGIVCTWARPGDAISQL